jgi:restriction endonuclease S subunit
MTILSFPTVKLKKYIRRINTRAKDLEPTNEKLVVYGVTNTDGIVITGNQASEDLGSYIVIKENQFAYNPYRINVGSIGLVPQVTAGIVSPAYIVFETNEDLDSRFLLYYLKSSLGLRLIRWYGDRGGVRAALRYNDLENIDIPKMSLEQQNKFLNKVQVVEEQINSLNCSIEQQKNILVRLRQSILQDAVQGKLVPQDPNDEPTSELLKKIQAEKDRLIKEKKIKKEKPLPKIRNEEIPYDLPHGWEWVRIGRVLEVGTGTTPLKSRKEYYENGTIPWITSASTNQPFICKSTECITELALRENNLSIYPKETLIVALYGQGKTRGQVSELMIDTTTNQACAALSLYIKSMELKQYIKLFFLKSYQEIRDLAAGGAQPNLNLGKIQNAIIPIPPLNEQKRIVAKVDQLMQLCDELEESITQAQKDSELLMQAVLQEAFGGNKTEPIEKIEILLDSVS